MTEQLGTEWKKNVLTIQHIHFLLIYHEGIITQIVDCLWLWQAKMFRC